MKCLHAIFAALLSIAFLAPSCVKQVPTATMITESESKALELAKKEFVKTTGRELEDYRVTIETDPNNSEKWIVWFDQDGPYPVPGGDHFVTVEKATGRTEFFFGD